mgnify:CR=1 FL=1
MKEEQQQIVDIEGFNEKCNQTLATAPASLMADIDSEQREKDRDDTMTRLRERFGVASPI